MLTEEGIKKLPRTTFCCAVIFQENQNPKRVVVIHNDADPKVAGKKGKPAGNGPPGGGGEENETPYDTVRREVLNETGIMTEYATCRKDSKFGEILYEEKLVLDDNDQLAINEVYVFHLKMISGELRTITEPGETGRLTFATYGSILTMPLARKTEQLSDGSEKIIENSEGVYFQARERFFGVAAYLEYDFYELIPNLDELFPKIKREEVGWYIYGLLSETIEKKKEEMAREAKLLEEARIRRTKILGSPEDDELLERYAAWTDGAPHGK